MSIHLLSSAILLAIERGPAKTSASIVIETSGWSLRKPRTRLRNGPVPDFERPQNHRRCYTVSAARIVRRAGVTLFVALMIVSVAPVCDHRGTPITPSRKGTRMARLTPEEFAQKWATRTAAATPEYQAGIQRVQTAPGQLAAAKETKYQASVQQVVTSGKWRRNVGAVSLQQWQQSALEKGAQRLASGAQAAQGKMAAAGARILPMIDAVKSEVDRMPDNTIEDRIAKAAAFARGMNKRANGGTGR